MKRLFYIALVLMGVTIPTFGQDSRTEAYFHELKGMEDSAGVTHLFYRTYISQETPCTDMEGNSSTIGLESDHIHHFNTSNAEDSVEFRSSNSIVPGCYEEWSGTEKFIFTADHPDSIFSIKSAFGALSGRYYFSISENHQFNLNVGNPLGLSFDEAENTFVITTPFDHLILNKTTTDEPFVRKSFRYAREDYIWKQFSYTSDLPDSLLIDFTVTGINPYKKGNYVGIKDSNIVLSSDHGNTFKPLLKHPWEESKLLQSRFRNTYFDADSNSFYITFQNRSRHFPERDDDVYLIQKNPDTWQLREISNGYSSFRFSPDRQTSGAYYFSNNDSLLHTNDYGNSSTLLTTFSHPITGLYKKPDSELLYVLTKEELLEVNIETKSTTSLKQLPVSSEQYTEVPSRVELEQNYPNPFNPTTVIRYQLTGNSLVRLEVFDVAGRKVATLVDGTQQAAGSHRISFDASNLSSGVYFYRLQTAGQTLTKKMLLVK